jgi:ribosomal protein S21
MAGVAALLLFLALLASTAPGVFRRVKRQREYAGAWEDVHEAEFGYEPMTAKGLRRGRTWKRKMKRMTGFYGHDDEDRTTRRHRGRGRRR